MNNSFASVKLRKGWWKWDLHYFKLFIHWKGQWTAVDYRIVEFLKELKRSFLILNNEETESDGLNQGGNCGRLG